MKNQEQKIVYISTGVTNSNVLSAKWRVNACVVHPWTFFCFFMNKLHKIWKDTLDRFWQTVFFLLLQPLLNADYPFCLLWQKRVFIFFQIKKDIWFFVRQLYCFFRRDFFQGLFYNVIIIFCCHLSPFYIL